jgi:hypothetical protein
VIGQHGQRWNHAKGNIVTVTIAALTLITTLVIAWRQHHRQQNAYLVLALKLEEVNHDHLVVHTSLDNRSELRKQIDAVQLIVCPYNEKPEHAAIKLRPDLAGRLKDMRDIASVDLKGPLPADPKTGDPLPGDGRVWLPLLYYTKENHWVADEILTCDAVIDVRKFKPGRPYSVRLVLVGPKWRVRTMGYNILYNTVHWVGFMLYRGVRRLFFLPRDQTPQPRYAKPSQPDVGLYRVVHKSFVR